MWSTSEVRRPGAGGAANTRTAPSRRIPGRAARGVLAALGALAATLAGCAPELSPPNVLLISIDTLRRDHCSLYGYGLPTTPTLEALADAGVRFDRFYAPSATTAPSHAALFTGHFQGAHGVVKNGVPLEMALPTLAEHFAAAGYQTAGAVSSYPLHRRFGFRRGFSAYYDRFETDTSTMHPGDWEGHRVGGAFDRRAELTTEWVLRWLARRRDPERRFFLFVHYFDPHAPYAPPEPYADRFATDPTDPLATAVASYDGEIAYVDAQVARLTDALEAAGLGDDTLVVVTADHGEGLMDHGITRHGPQLYEEAVRIPLVLRWPARLPARHVISQPYSLIDLGPTLLELAGLDPAGLAGPGRSFARAAGGDVRSDDEWPVFLQRRHYRGGQVQGREVRGDLFGIVDGHFKYLVAPDEGEPELYDLTDDPGEKVNRIDRERERADRLALALARWRGAEGAPADAPALDAADRSALEALGYVE